MNAAMSTSLMLCSFQNLAPALVALGVMACQSKPQKESTMTLAPDVYAFELKTIDGKAEPFSQYKGKVLLLVNVASECGFTRQYAGLEELHQKYQSQGLVVLGIPANEFGGQEPGTNEEIRTFCESKFHVTFPLTEKVVVKGPGQVPLYGWLTAQKGEVTWNFNKFLIDRDGKLVEHYESKVEPMSPELSSAIEKALAH